MMGKLAARFREFATSHTKGVVIAAVVLVLAGYASSHAAVMGNDQHALPDTGAVTVEEDARGILSFTLESPDWVQAEDQAIVVKISGTTASGENVSDQYQAVPDKKYLTPLRAGEYQVSLLTGEPTQGTHVYKADAQSVSFDGTEDVNVVLVMTLDAEATAQKQAAAEKAAQEKAEKAAAEKAAKEAAEAEAARVAQEQAAAAEAARIAQEQAAAEAAAAAAAQQNERTVYVAASGNGKKYHSKSTCSNMKGTITMTVSEAEAAGYGPCKKCY